MTINSLFNLARKGDKTAEKQMSEKLIDRFSLFAHRKVWDNEAAREMVQEAIMTVIAEYRQLDEDVVFSAWAHRVMENKFLAYIQTRRRQAGRNVSLSDPDHQADVPVRDPTLKTHLLECFKEVSKANRRYARILNLHYQGYDRKEVCEKLNMTVDQSYVVMSRARALLQDCLKEKRIEI